MDTVEEQSSLCEIDFGVAQKPTLAYEFRPKTIQELLASTPDQIRCCDLARMNLLCATGLQGAEDINVEQYLNRLDYWTKQAFQITAQREPEWQTEPHRFGNSRAHFLMTGIMYILGKHYSVRYRPERITDPHYWADSRDSLIHGVLGPSRSGTCSSLPVAMVAMGRRLGYPIKLISCPGHLFVRWHDTKERHNFDWNDHGLGYNTDEHYKYIRNLWNSTIEAMEQTYRVYLVPFEPEREFAYCITTRAHCLVAIVLVQPELEKPDCGVKCAAMVMASCQAARWKARSFIAFDSRQRERGLADG